MLTDEKAAYHDNYSCTRIKYRVASIDNRSLGTASEAFRGLPIRYSRVSITQAGFG